MGRPDLSTVKLIKALEGDSGSRYQTAWGGSILVGSVHLDSLHPDTNLQPSCPSNGESEVVGYTDNIGPVLAMKTTPDASKTMGANGKRVQEAIYQTEVSIPVKGPRSLRGSHSQDQPTLLRES